MRLSDNMGPLKLAPEPKQLPTTAVDDRFITENSRAPIDMCGAHCRWEKKKLRDKEPYFFTTKTDFYKGNPLRLHRQVYFRAQETRSSGNYARRYRNP